MMKYEIYTSIEMEGLYGAHNNGDGGWLDTLSWIFSKSQVVPAGHLDRLSIP